MSTLPPLPEPVIWEPEDTIPSGYTADQLTAYAQAALSAQRESLIEQCAKVLLDLAAEVRAANTYRGRIGQGPLYAIDMLEFAAADILALPERGEE